MINPRVLSLDKSTTLKITSLTKKLIKEGKDVINFAAGEPDFDTPSFIKEEAIKAINEGFTKYTPSTGIVELKEAIAEKLRKENKLDTEAKNIVVVSGAKYAVFAAIFTIVSDDKEVIIPSPYWVSYPEIVKLTGAKIKILETKISDNFKIRPEALRKAITSRTKVLILNYPNNPTGQTYGASELQSIYDVIKEKGIFVLSDEIYEKLIYDGKKHTSFATFGNAKEFTITINGFSKAFSMTGWRLGYLAANEKIIEEISKIVDHTTSCPASIAQKAGLAALKDKDWQKYLSEEFQKRRNIIYEGLKGGKYLKPLRPEGTFYLFCDVRETGLSSLEFCSRLLEEALVSCIPADSFGAAGFIRLSFSTEAGQIEKGIDRIKKFLKGI